MITQADGVRTSLKTLRTRVDDQVLQIELHQPEQGNAVTDAMLDELLAVLDDHRSGIRVIVLSGAGENFCLGGDRSEFDGYMAEDPTGSGVRASGTRARRVCDALTGHPAVTIARVHGKAIGAGVALALACDLRVGAETAAFRLPELALGLPTAWGGLLPRLLNEVGAARVREIVLTGRSLDAYEARAMSILQNVVPEQRLDDAVAAWVRPVLRRPESALRVTKALFNAYTAATHMADARLLEPELVTAVVSAAHYARQGSGAHEGVDHGPDRTS